jgi:hypothetical protein
MPNATVPATARAMPKTTNRRGALCAVLAAGAVGATAVLPAAAPARTVDGMHAKIAFASIFNLDEREDLVQGTMVDLLISAAMDYADLNGQEARS